MIDHLRRSKILIICALILTSCFTAAKSVQAEDKGRLSPGFIAFCPSPTIKKIIIDTLNGSAEFKSAGINVVDFQDPKTLSVDPTTQKFSCHGRLVSAGGKTAEGTIVVAVNDKGSDVDWYDDQAEHGFAAMADTGNQIPADEIAFINAVKAGQEAYASATTDFARGTNRPVRAAAICAALKSMSVRNWIGQLTELTTNDEGKGIVTITIARDIKIMTWNNSVSDIGNDTLVEPQNPLFKSLGSLQTSDKVKFSGTFFQKTTDCVRESSFTMRGSMLEPEFIMRFTDVRKFSAP